jgi:hypothetical protein
MRPPEWKRLSDGIGREKIGCKALFVAQPLLAVRFLQLQKRRNPHSREWMCYCYSIFASNSTNFCCRSDWSLPSSASAFCVTFMEQNFGPHMEQNFASL